ncbi:hypothetical protein [Bdellovibrio sp. HCB337]|uniref:hypothetical protein n=1 Tax=Bdellovibrio sp. HCB337 TaxID=3394358 RepID=UPI0039A4D482
MLKDEVSVQFQGFHPSEFTRSHVDLVMSELQDEAPSNATLKGVFSRKDHTFKAVVSIHSFAGKFFASASGTKLKDVTDQILQQLRRKLGQWKSDRYKKHEVKEQNLTIREVDYDTDFVA